MESSNLKTIPLIDRNSMLTAILLLIILLVAGNSYAQEIMFIHARPCGETRTHQSYPCYIFRYDSARKELRQVWSLKLDANKNMRVQYVHVFSSKGPIIISEGPDPKPEKLHILSPMNIGYSHLVDMSNLGYVSSYFYFQEFNGKGKIIAEYMADMTKMGFQYAWFDIESGSITNKSDSMLAGGELRLSGAQNEYAGGYDDDVITYRRLKDIPINPNSLDILFHGSSPPDSIVKMINSYGWAMIANEADYRALVSRPDKNGLIKREVLLCDRKNGTWSSLLIDGAETSLRPINGWLTGVIADPDPETDYAIRKGFPPKLREDVVIINPLGVHQFKVHLGKQSEVLWIEDSTTYYRVGDGLYKAKIRNDDFVERTLLVRDARVKQIHWAFRGSMGDSIR